MENNVRGSDERHSHGEKRVNDLGSSHSLFFEDILEDIPLPVAIIDPDDKDVRSNQAFYAMTGYSHEELIRELNLQAFFTHTGYSEYNERTVSSKKNISISKLSIKCKNGTCIPLNIIDREPLDVNGDKRAHKVVIFADTPEGSKIPFNINEKRYQVLVEVQNDLIVCFDKFGIITFANEAICKYAGIGKEEMIGNMVDRIVSQELREALLKEIGSMSMDYHVLIKECQFKKHDGSVRWIEWINHCMFDDRGNFIECQSIGKDITSRKTIDEEIKNNEQMFNKLFNQINDIVFTMDRYSRLLSVSGKWFEKYGIKEDLLRGRSPWEVLETKDPNAIIDVLERAFSGEETSYEWSGSYQGRIFYFQISLSPIRDRKGDIIGVLGIGREITDSKCMEKELQDKEAWLCRITDNMRDIVMEIDNKSVITYVTPSVKTVLGYGTEEIIGRSVFDFSHPEDIEKIVKMTIQALKTGKGGKMEHRIRDINGKYLWFETIDNPVTDSSGNVTKAVIGIRDITDRKKIEDELIKSERSYRILAEGAKDIIFIISKDLTIDYINNFVSGLFNVRREDVVGRNITELLEGKIFHRIMFDNIKEKLRMIFTSGSPMTSEDLLTINGKDIWLNTHLIPIDGTEGEIISVMGISRDVTDYKKAEKALRESEQLLAKAQQIAHLGSWNWDFVNDSVICSDEAYRILGIYPVERETDTDILSSNIDPLDKHIIEDHINEAKRDKRSFQSIDVRIVQPDGSKRIAHVEGEMIFNDAGSAVRMYGTIQDVTERKKVELALMEAKLQAELYVDLMSHDISNINQIIMGYLELARDMSGMEDESRRFIEKSFEALKNSSNLINNVRKIQMTRSGELKYEGIDLGKILSEICSEYTNIPGTDVEINIKDYNDRFVRANELLKDVFVNIVGNSIKHSGGLVIIDIYLTRAFESGKEYYKVIIDDNGPGIPDEIKCKIFDRSWRGETKTKGRGLGLFLVKTLVDSFQGRVWVEDKVPGETGKGSRFIVMLPSFKSTMN
ncbi:hypothetical protein CUJ83_01015 [Methanocella sp. CWC-04]|uniref:histidine kinase n=1 Tax=Methanooceanicella nereidis TaxID=2052831 RepID=A0AAP2W4S5_9EURY|nr:PAS domain-containing sensor histidine kinase [Methanocella sp. CWC-04]MCD1293577.1 hypothetical protein [Methanocella sp. CWC-04]